MEHNFKSGNKPLNLQSVDSDKGAKKIYWGRNHLFKKWYQDNWIATCKRKKLDPTSHQTQKLSQMGQRNKCKSQNYKF